MTEDKPTIQSLSTQENPTWCTSCGDFSILSVLKTALVDLGIEQKDVLIVSGIGCGSKLPHYLKTYGFEGLHGRVMPVATGAKIANTKLKVIGVAGDGDSLGIGGNHFIHSLRRNLDITYIIQDNAVYGLTKGQTSPTSQKGFKSNSTPLGVIEEAFNPMAMGISGGATYVARGFAFDIPHLKKIITDAISHRGFSIVDVLQPCKTFNKVNTLEFYKENIYRLEDKGHDPKDKKTAIERSREWGKKSIPIGLFYKEDKPTYEDGIPQATHKPLTEHNISKVDISKFLKQFK
ncbi:2-oxoacid:ferredoxin oxidoreductase subunit beta [Candidatus Aenigmatarchaeota archaeon]